MKRISINIIVVLLLLLQSCIKEDLSTCKTELLLRFRYTLNDQNTNLFYPEVNRIMVYVFDEQGKYVDSFSEQGSVLTNEYVMHIPLPAGKYKVVVYGGPLNTYTIGELNDQTNALSPTLIKGVTDINDLRAELKNIAGEEGYLYPENVPDDLYAGLSGSVTSSMNNQQVTDIDLIKITKKIKVKITDLDNPDVPYELFITDQNGRYQFDTNIDPSLGAFKYKPITTLIQPNYMEVDLKTMRLMLGKSPMLVVRNKTTSEVIYNENMIDQILATQKYVTQEDFDREDEFVVEITIQSKNISGGITVSINGWVITGMNPDVS